MSCNNCWDSTDCKEYEDVTGGECPKCGTCIGTTWETEEGNIYTVEPHGRMGNRSYKEDKIVSEWCPKCDYRKDY